MNNERGSLVMVLLLVMVSMMTIATLLSYLSQERQLIGRYDDRYESQLYEYENTEAAAKHVMQQVVRYIEREYDDSPAIFVETEEVDFYHTLLNGHTLSGMPTETTFEIVPGSIAHVFQDDGNPYSFREACEREIRTGPGGAEIEDISCQDRPFRISMEVEMASQRGDVVRELTISDLQTRVDERGRIRMDFEWASMELN